MSAIYAVTDGVNPIVAADLNQYGTTLNNQFGVTDTAQPTLGRLVLPYVGADPGGPTNGQMWWRSDLGVDGQLRTYRNGLTIPHLGLRQQVLGANPINTTVTNVAYTDIANATLSITTQGGRLVIYLLAEDGLDSSIYCEDVSGGGYAAAGGWIRAVVGATNLGGISAPRPAGTAPTFGTFNMLRWQSSPAAGAVTVKLQAKGLAASFTIGITQYRLVVEEWDI